MFACGRLESLPVILLSIKSLAERYEFPTTYSALNRRSNVGKCLLPPRLSPFNVMSFLN